MMLEPDLKIIFRLGARVRAHFDLVDGRVDYGFALR
jgi:hypothetical protein